MKACADFSGGQTPPAAQNPWRLHSTLNPKQGTKQLASAHVPHALPAAQTAALLPPTSVTEGTTERLFPPRREKDAVLVKPHKTDTAEIKH